MEAQERIPRVKRSVKVCKGLLMEKVSGMTGPVGRIIGGVKEIK